MNKRITIALLSILFLQFSVFSQTDSLRDKFDTILFEFGQKEILKHASWAFTAIDNSTSEVLYSHNSHLTLMPASTMKVLTSGAALEIFGANHKFETQFAISGKLDAEGTLYGNVYIIGGGDPTFGSHRFEDETNLDTIYKNAIKALQKLGVKSVKGKVIADASYFDNEIVVPTWQYDDIGNYYGAGVSGLSVHENYFDFLFKSGKYLNKDVQLIGIEPAASYLHIVNEVKSAGKYTGDQVYIYGAPYSDIRFLTGTIPVNRKKFIVSGSMPDPAFFAAWSFNNALDSAGIKTLYPPTTHYRMQWQGEQDSLTPRTVHTYHSPELHRIVFFLNHRSNNMYAETMLKHLGKQYYGEGTYKNGIKAIKAFWNSKGIETAGLKMADGSGLSRKNGVTSQTLAEVIQYMMKSKNSEYFIGSLPEAGVSGNLKYMFRKSPAKGKLSAKSGTISGVKAYTGLMKTKGGKEISFAIIINQYNGSQSQLKKEIAKLLESLYLV